MNHVRFALPCAFSKPYPLENYVIPGLSDILKFMAGWFLPWFSAAWTPSWSIQKECQAFGVPDRSIFSNCRVQLFPNLLFIRVTIMVRDANPRHIGYLLPIVCAPTDF
jgi:hypothetical protein